MAISQITSLNFLLNHNCETNLYEVKLKILEGNAMSAGQRSQFNSQISLVIPTGLNFEIVERFNPIKNNQNYDGSEAMNWGAFTPVVSPPEQPENDFYSISPQLAPASFYNNLSEGDEVLLFACKIGDDDEYNPDIRFYDNDNDPAIQSVGSDFRNGFAIGSPVQIYNTNEYKSCVSSTYDIESELKAYPNPFHDQLVIKSEIPISSLTISDANGTVHYSNKNIGRESIVISTENLPRGLYTIKCEFSTGTKTIKTVKY
ncbi:MAG: hypothetical protein ACJA1A_002897 [Saprospiraceae bacterium]|jgi:hypothetical protein|tara:strand:+ start:843 stop:1619 length:777 start_codon:yes stop_codon:yes gene_type:complete